VLTRDSRLSILAIGILFIVGGILLSRVDVRAGQQAARGLEQEGG
jgi:MFS-type transporter involved in bile tolerance (Atg22 family)